MFYGLATRKIRSSRLTFRHELSDIETLNIKASQGVYHLSAISYHAYPYVADKYVLMNSGSSIGDGYGPLVVAMHPMEPEEIKGKKLATVVASAFANHDSFAGDWILDHPPGFYGPADGPLAVNTLAAADRVLPLDTSSLRARRASYTNSEPRDLRGILLSSAMALFLIDAVIVALLGGGIAALVRRRAAAAVLAVALALPAVTAPSPTRADSNDDFAVKATTQTRLAYVLTGNADVDSIVRSGMSGLTLFLAQRTALEAGDPVGVDPARDELAFFPLIYWPVVPGAAKPPQEAIDRIDAYMKQGGTVLFDTRDAIEAPPGENGASQTPGMQALRNILSSLDIPELEPVPREHVLTKTFYLLRDFPGRYDTGQTWVETLPREDDEDAASHPARGGDGVSPIIITSNDLAGAWAIRPDGQPMLPLSPGEPRQREFAFRAGVNIVMYTLTGNYKADQVHAPALIERLGQ